MASEKHLYGDGVFMLKLTIHDNAEMLRFQLEGKLAGAWVRELEQCWRTASSTLGSRALQVDVRHVTDMDDAGRALLLQLRSSGADLVKAEGKQPKKNWLQRLTACSRASEAS
jgi:ABC-type transporter Mla MlaB component